VAYSAYSPDLPGCVSTGRNREEAEQNMREAIAFHLDGLREEGGPVPEPHTYSASLSFPLSRFDSQVAQSVTAISNSATK
jgi:predicted RNase H-like HicB family nuclease